MIESMELDTLNIINDLDDLVSQKVLKIKILNQDYVPFFEEGNLLELNLVEKPKDGDLVIIIYEDVDYIKSPEGRFVRRICMNRIIGEYSFNQLENIYQIKNISQNRKQIDCISENGIYRNRIAGVLHRVS